MLGLIGQWTTPMVLQHLLGFQVLEEKLQMHFP